jgi:hypothetical protein
MPESSTLVFLALVISSSGLADILNTGACAANTSRRIPMDSRSELVSENKCYAVVFMNYYPLEVDSLWETRAGAQGRIQELTNPGNWDVCEMEIRKGQGS